MHLILCQVLGVLLGVCAWSGLARSVLNGERFPRGERYLSDDTSYGDTGSTLEARNTTQLVIRETSYPDDSPDGIDCLSLCGAVSNPTKRGWEQLEPRNGLVKRVFDPWPPLDNSDKGKDKFMVIACDALTPAQAITPGWAEEPPGYASAVTAPFGTTAFRFGTQRICGCTMLFVVSRKRVYLAHYWEDVSFGKAKTAEHPLQFDEQVLDFLKNGFTAPGGPTQDSLQQHADDFKGIPGLVAWIVTPDRVYTKAPSGNPYYYSKIPTMSATVATILGIEVEEVKVRTYIAVDKKKDSSNALSNTAAGHMIFDFDPTGGDRKEPFAWRIIWQNSLIDADQWPKPSV